jgi:hypothetical protein
VTGADETVDPYGKKYDGRIGLGLDRNSKTSTVDLLFGKYDKLLCLIQIEYALIPFTLMCFQRVQQCVDSWTEDAGRPD